MKVDLKHFALFQKLFKISLKVRQKKFYWLINLNDNKTKLLTMSGEF